MKLVGSRISNEGSTYILHNDLRRSDHCLGVGFLGNREYIVSRFKDRLIDFFYGMR